ncbi:MAG: hypothetical protein M1827_004867 [Pycnora praestabilis]|nr:MAG: hypothetical protein M1827_004867 [Pycnora praestabilis]
MDSLAWFVVGGLLHRLQRLLLFPLQYQYNLDLIDYPGNSKLPACVLAYLSDLISGLQNAYTQLPTSIRDRIDSALQHTVFDFPEVLVTAVLASIVVIVSMGSWGRRIGGWGGRFSPFAGGSNGYPPQVTDDDFSYITHDDLAAHQRTFDPHTATRPSPRASLGPDIIILRHKKATYPLHFPAYSIDDGVLTVGALRAQAAKEAGADDVRRVKLVYKGRALKDDLRPCREEGLKVESEVFCVVSDPVVDAESSSESDNDELGMPLPEDGSAPSKRKRVRNKKKKSGKRSGGSSSTGTSTPNLAPPIDPFQASGTSRPTTPSVPPPQAPKTALEKLAEISSQFHTKFVPQCVQYASNPPSDPSKMDFEHKKLSEMILAQVLLKLDAVETEGDPDARQMRKDLVKETQAILSKLDAIRDGRA